MTGGAVRPRALVTQRVDGTAAVDRGLGSWRGRLLIMGLFLLALCALSIATAAVSQAGDRGPGAHSAGGGPVRAVTPDDPSSERQSGHRGGPPGAHGGSSDADRDGTPPGRPPAGDDAGPPSEPSIPPSQGQAGGPASESPGTTRPPNPAPTDDRPAPQDDGSAGEAGSTVPQSDGADGSAEGDGTAAPTSDTATSEAPASEIAASDTATSDTATSETPVAAPVSHTAAPAVATPAPPPAEPTAPTYVADRGPPTAMTADTGARGFGGRSAGPAAEREPAPDRRTPAIGDQQPDTPTPPPLAPAPAPASPAPSGAPGSPSGHGGGATCSPHSGNGHSGDLGLAVLTDAETASIARTSARSADDRAGHLAGGAEDPGLRPD